MEAYGGYQQHGQNRGNTNKVLTPLEKAKKIMANKAYGMPNYVHGRKGHPTRTTACTLPQFYGGYPSQACTSNGTVSMYPNQPSTFTSTTSHGLANAMEQMALSGHPNPTANTQITQYYPGYQACTSATTMIPPTSQPPQQHGNMGNSMQQQHMSTIALSGHPNPTANTQITQYYPGYQASTSTTTSQPAQQHGNMVNTMQQQHMSTIALSGYPNTAHQLYPGQMNQGPRYNAPPLHYQQQMNYIPSATVNSSTSRPIVSQSHGVMNAMQPQISNFAPNAITSGPNIQGQSYPSWGAVPAYPPQTAAVTSTAGANLPAMQPQTNYVAPHSMNPGPNTQGQSYPSWGAVPAYPPQTAAVASTAGANVPAMQPQTNYVAPHSMNPDPSTRGQSYPSWGTFPAYPPPTTASVYTTAGANVPAMQPQTNYVFPCYQQPYASTAHPNAHVHYQQQMNNIPSATIDSSTSRPIVSQSQGVMNTMQPQISSFAPNAMNPDPNTRGQSYPSWGTFPAYPPPTTAGVYTTAGANGPAMQYQNYPQPNAGTTNPNPHQLNPGQLNNQTPRYNAPQLHYQQQMNNIPSATINSSTSRPTVSQSHGVMNAMQPQIPNFAPNAMNPDPNTRGQGYPSWGTFPAYPPQTTAVVSTSGANVPAMQPQTNYVAPHSMNPDPNTQGQSYPSWGTFPAYPPPTTAGVYTTAGANVPAMQFQSNYVLPSSTTNTTLATAPAANISGSLSAGSAQPSSSSRPVASETPAPGRKYVLEDFLKDRPRNLQLKTIVQMSNSERGSNFILAKLEKATPSEKQLVIDEIRDHIHTIMSDHYGAFVIQKLFQNGSQEETRKLIGSIGSHTFHLALDKFGARTLQIALECIEEEQQVLILNELKPYLLECVRNRYGNHVIRACIKCVPTAHLDFIVDGLRGQVINLSTHGLGNRVIRDIVELWPQEQKAPIVDEMYQHARALSKHNVGHRTIKIAMDHENSIDKVVSRLLGKVYTLSQDENAGTVIQKCLDLGSSEDRRLMIEEVCRLHGEQFRNMVEVRSASYVLQKMLEFSDPLQSKTLCHNIHPFARKLKKNHRRFAKQLVSKWETVVNQSKKDEATANPPSTATTSKSH